MSKVNDILYNQLCDFAECDSRFAEEINITYSTTIQKMANFMESVLRNTSITSEQIFN